MLDLHQAQFAPHAKRFVEIATGFKEDWGIQLQSFIELDGRDEAINAIMTARHLIAHGKNSDISVYRVSAYFDKSVKVAEFIESQLLE
ncbi:MAG: HEPN domain-containing protein [Limisphaerales bacterium]